MAQTSSLVQIAPPRAVGRARRSWPVGLIVGSWLVTVAGAVWWYELKALRTFGQEVVQFEVAALPVPAVLAGRDTIKIVHFYDQSCGCNRKLKNHIEQLKQSFDPARVEHHLLSRGGGAAREPWFKTGFSRLDERAAGALLAVIPSSPGVAIWDQQDRLAYFGPYGLGAECVAGAGFVEGVITSLLAGGRPTVTATLAVGCFCDWR